MTLRQNLALVDPTAAPGPGHRIVRHNCSSYSRYLLLIHQGGWSNATSDVVFSRDSRTVARGRDSLAKFLADIESLRGLPHDWNGYGSERPNETAIYNARSVLMALADSELALFPDRVVPSAEGGIAICFVADERYADIECFNSGDAAGVVKTFDMTIFDVFSIDIQHGAGEVLSKISDFLAA